MSPQTTLILMPCSSTKLETDKPVPMHELYQGPLWQTLRAYRGAIPWHHVCVLSGGQGFCNARTHCPSYNARLSEETADAFIDAGIYARDRVFAGPSPMVTIGGRRPVYTTVINAGSGHYARVFDAFIQEFLNEGAIAADARIVRIAGGIGEQRSQLGELLREINGHGATLLGRIETDEKIVAERKWQAPLKPGANQQQCDIGLFSDDHKQQELFK